MNIITCVIVDHTYARWLIEDLPLIPRNEVDRKRGKNYGNTKDHPTAGPHPCQAPRE